MDSNHRPDGKQPSALPLSYRGKRRNTLRSCWKKLNNIANSRLPIGYLGGAGARGSAAVERLGREPFGRVTQRAFGEVPEELSGPTRAPAKRGLDRRSEEHTSELQPSEVSI